MLGLIEGRVSLRRLRGLFSYWVPVRGKDLRGADAHQCAVHLNLGRKQYLSILSWKDHLDYELTSRSADKDMSNI